MFGWSASAIHRFDCNAQNDLRLTICPDKHFAFNTQCHQSDAVSHCCRRCHRYHHRVRSVASRMFHHVASFHHFLALFCICHSIWYYLLLSCRNLKMNVWWADCCHLIHMKSILSTFNRLLRFNFRRYTSNSIVRQPPFLLQPIHETLSK